MSTPDLVALALNTTREEFVQKSPHYFLFGETTLVPPSAPHRTGEFALVEDTNPGQWMADYTEVPDPIETTRAPELVVFPIRKALSAWPAMITVGRTRNHDIVLNDVSVSKFHAFFRVVEEQLELSDAGSLVGTWVGDVRLTAKGAPLRVGAGQTVRFAHHEFQVLAAGDFWTRLRARQTIDGGADGGTLDGSL